MKTLENMCVLTSTIQHAAAMTDQLVNQEKLTMLIVHKACQDFSHLLFSPSNNCNKSNLLVMILGFGLLDKTNIVKVSLWVILTAFLTIFRFFNKQENTDECRK